MTNRDTVQWLLPRVVGKSVLYVGTMDDEPGNARKHPPIHRALGASAATLLGIYRSESQAAELRAEGLDAVAGSVEALSLNRSFDVIVAADTIEHAENAGRFLAALESHLAPGGSLLITTPNPNGLVRIVELVVRGKSKANPAHTCWYTGQVLDQLARRVGLTIAEEAWIDDMRKYHQPNRSKGLGHRFASRMLVGGNRVTCRLFAQFSETSAFVLVRR